MTLFISILGFKKKVLSDFINGCIFCSIFNRSPFLLAKVFHMLCYVNSVHIQPTLPHGKRNMEPPTKNTPFEEESLPTPKTKMAIEHPPFTKMFFPFFPMKNGEMFQCYVQFLGVHPGCIFHPPPRLEPEAGTRRCNAFIPALGAPTNSEVESVSSGEAILVGNVPWNSWGFVNISSSS